MANLTRKSIMESFMKLLDERPLSKISVKDIVEDCGVNRNTFYYHFQDIPDLVEAIVLQEADRIMQNAHGIQSLEECVEAATAFSMAHKRAIQHIYNSANREFYERYLMDVCDYTVRAFMDNAFQDIPADESDRETIIQGYKCECFGLIIDWLNHGMDTDMRQRVLRLCELRHGMTEEMLRRSAEQQNGN